MKTTHCEGSHQAREAFRVTSAHLNGATDAVPVALGAGVVGYQFTTPSGPVFVLWTTHGSTTIALPLTVPAVAVTESDGRTTTADSQALTVGVSPIVVRARESRAARRGKTPGRAEERWREGTRRKDGGGAPAG